VTICSNKYFQPMGGFNWFIKASHWLKIFVRTYCLNSIDESRRKKEQREKFWCKR